ncbi:MAG: hypothetical protein AAF614_12070 [Chloroflexota bacterium]
MASLLGWKTINVVKPTRSLALQALKEQIEQRVAQGELLFLDIDSPSISSLAGKYADDPTLQAICDEAYAQRDAEYDAL